MDASACKAFVTESVAISNFEGSPTFNQISIEAGNQVLALDKSLCCGWRWVCNVKGQCGYVPASFIRDVAQQNFQFGRVQRVQASAATANVDRGKQTKEMSNTISSGKEKQSKSNKFSDVRQVYRKYRSWEQENVQPPSMQPANMDHVDSFDSILNASASPICDLSRQQPACQREDPCSELSSLTHGRPSESAKSIKCVDANDERNSRHVSFNEHSSILKDTVPKKDIRQSHQLHDDINEGTGGSQSINCSNHRTTAATLPVRSGFSHEQQEAIEGMKHLVRRLQSLYTSQSERKIGLVNAAPHASTEQLTITSGPCPSSKRYSTRDGPANHTSSESEFQRVRNQMKHLANVLKGKIA